MNIMKILHLHMLLTQRVNHAVFPSVCVWSIYSVTFKNVLEVAVSY